MARDPFVRNEDGIRKMGCIVKYLLNALSTQNTRLIYTSYKSFLILIFNNIHLLSNSLKFQNKHLHPLIIPSLLPFAHILQKN